MRTGVIVLLLVGLAACNRGSQNKEAVRQGVMDHLSGRNLNLASMDVNVSDVQFNGNKADATVIFTPKGGPSSQGMTLHYQMEQKGGKWEVTETRDSGHSGAVAPGTANPHGGAAPSDNPHGAMPAPEDLPPAGKK